MIVSIPDFIAWAVGCWLPAVALVDATSAIILSHETLNKEKLQLFDFKGSARNSYSRSNVRSSLLNAGMSFQTKNLRYLRLTNDTVLRLVIYIKEHYVPWYTDSKIHPDVLEALQPIVLKQLIGDNDRPQTKRKKGEGAAEIHRGPNFQFAYYFTTEDTHHSVIRRNPTYIFPEPTEDEDDEEEEEDVDRKPTLHVEYDGLSMYPEQLVIVVEPYDADNDPDFFGFQYKNTITKYLETAASSS